jgi:hypothetical protein
MISRKGAKKYKDESASSVLVASVVVQFLGFRRKNVRRPTRFLLAAWALYSFGAHGS